MQTLVSVVLHTDSAMLSQRIGMCSVPVPHFECFMWTGYGDMDSWFAPA